MEKLHKTLICVFLSLGILCTLTGCGENETYPEKGKYYLAETGAYIEVKDIEKSSKYEETLGTVTLQFVNYDFDYLKDSFYFVDVSEQFSEKDCTFEYYIYEGIYYLETYVDESDIKLYLKSVYEKEGLEYNEEDFADIESQPLTLAMTYRPRDKSLKLMRTDEKFILR